MTRKFKVGDVVRCVFVGTVVDDKTDYMGDIVVQIPPGKFYFNPKELSLVKIVRKGKKP